MSGFQPVPTCGCVQSLVRRADRPRLREALGRYPDHYDDVLEAVGVRLAVNVATKLDLAALIAWKHVRNAVWMRELLLVEEQIVAETTTSAFASGLTDTERLVALRPLPGFGSGGAFTSVLLAAWDSSRYGVYDRIAALKLASIRPHACSCSIGELPTYWEHLRRIAAEMSTPRRSWTARMVDMALLNLS